MAVTDTFLDSAPTSKRCLSSFLAPFLASFLGLLLAACAAPPPASESDHEPTDPDWRYGIVERNVVTSDAVISTRAERGRILTIRADDGEILEITTAGGGFAAGSCVTLEAGSVKPAPTEACDWFAE
jgi:hypothetical protein